MAAVVIEQGIALATSVVTLVGMWLAGSKRWQGWAVGLANQALWLAFIVAFGAWGLLPLSAALIVVYSRNLVKWRREPALTYIQREGVELLTVRDGAGVIVTSHVRRVEP